MNRHEVDMLMTFVTSSNNRMDLALRICDVRDELHNRIVSRFKDTLKAALMRSLQDRNWTDWETVDLFDDNCVHQKWPKIFIAKKRWNHLSRIQLEGWRAGFRQVYCGVRLNHGELRRKYGETKFEDCRDAIIAVAKKAGFAGNKPSDMWPCCTNPDKLASWNSHAPLYELHARAGELAEDFASWMLGIAEATWQEIDHLHNA